MTDLQRLAEEQTATTEQAVLKIKAKQAVMDKLNEKGEATLYFKDGRVIYIDRLITGGYRVSDFKVLKRVWVNDIQGDMPVRDIAEQKELATKEETAEYVASKI